MRLEHNYKLIVVDEISMVPQNLWELLLSHHIPVIALGDPAQLNAILAESNTVLAHPHIFLDEIMRQAQDSEIIRLTMDIRAGKPLTLYRGKEVRVVKPSELNAGGIWQWPDQIIVSKNKTRHTINNFIRTELYHKETPYPEEGDKIICLRNDWNTINASGDALVNGATGTISNIHSTEKPNPFAEKTFMADFEPNFENSGIFTELEMDECLFTENRLSKNKVHPEYAVPLEFAPQQFDYGYAITAWKAQGSEYDNVLVLEENFPFKRDEHIRWLYTAATRASKKLIIVKDYYL